MRRMTKNLNKFEVLARYQSGKLSPNKAMKCLGMTEKGLAMTMFAYGSHLEWLLPKLDELKQPTKPAQTAVKQEIAERLGITYNQVNRMLRTGGVDVPRPEIVQHREVLHKNAVKKREKAEKVIKKLVIGEVSFEKAIETLHITKRQVARHVSDLCTELGYSVPAFKRLPATKKRELVAKHGA